MDNRINTPNLFTKVPIGEKLLQFIWQFQYFNKSHLVTSAGEPIHIVHPGKLNKDQGPDFSEARIKIGETLFAGSVELHIKTSDWNKHKHDTDRNYNNVILHVVYQHDISNNSIPVLELEPLISGLLLQKYDQMMHSQSFTACGSSMSSVKELTWSAWKERLVVERLTHKSNYVLQLLAESGSHWEETFWWMLARNFGRKINADIFEAIARSIPVSILAKNKGQIHGLEALLFGQANLLSGDFQDEYPKLLQREYAFLAKKYNLKKVHQQVHFLRMRPSNFPTIRLAQLAILINSSSHLFSKIIETEDVKDTAAFFTVTANDYWHYHYTFDEASPFKKKVLGQEMINNILINTIVPVLFSYGLYHKNENMKEKALRWLQETDPEINNITKSFLSYSIDNTSAFDSQALLELKNNYCEHKRCLDCAIGNAILKEPAAIYETLV